MTSEEVSVFERDDAEIDSMTVTELRKALSSIGCPTSGRKLDLNKRLKQAIHEHMDVEKAAVSDMNGEPILVDGANAITENGSEQLMDGITQRSVTRETAAVSQPQNAAVDNGVIAAAKDLFADQSTASVVHSPATAQKRTRDEALSTDSVGSSVTTASTQVAEDLVVMEASESQEPALKRAKSSVVDSEKMSGEFAQSILNDSTNGIVNSTLKDSTSAVPLFQGAQFKSLSDSKDAIGGDVSMSSPRTVVAAETEVSAASKSIAIKVSSTDSSSASASVSKSGSVEPERDVVEKGQKSMKAKKSVSPTQKGDVLKRRYSHLRNYLRGLDEAQLREVALDAIIKDSSILESMREAMSGSITLTKLFLRSLSYETTEDTLTTVFEQFGNVKEACIVKDKLTRKSRGFGFVTMTSADGSYRALKEFRKNVDNRKIVCNLASKPQGIRTYPTGAVPQRNEGPRRRGGRGQRSRLRRR